jgi:hypothetical protein
VNVALAKAADASPAATHPKTVNAFVLEAGSVVSD